MQNARFCKSAPVPAYIYTLCNRSNIVRKDGVTIMVSVSPAFQAAATADERRVVGYLYKGNEKLYGGDVIQSMKITELCGGGEDLVPGVCACSEAEAVLLNLDGALDGVFQTGQELIPHLGFLTESGEETVPMGVFAITSVENQDGKITLKLSDRMLRLEQPVTIESKGTHIVLTMGGRSRTLMLPYTIYSLFTALCYVAEVEPGGLVSNGAITPGNAFEGETSGRNLLAYIAQAAGGFARMDRSGRLEVKTYAAADAPLSLNDYFTVKEAGFSVPAVTELTVRAEEDDVGRTIGEPGVRYVITGNPLLYGLNGMTNYAPIMQNILDGMGARPYAPMEIEARGNPAVQAGDILTAALRDGRTAALPVMTHTLTYNGGLRDTLASTGKAAEAGEQKGAIGESLKALNRKSHVLETDVEHSKSVISEIVTQVPYIGPEPPENPEAGRLWQDEADPPVLREWNGSAWITAADKTTVISSAVQQTNKQFGLEFVNGGNSGQTEFSADGETIYNGGFKIYSESKGAVSPSSVPIFEVDKYGLVKTRGSIVREDYGYTVGFDSDIDYIMGQGEDVRGLVYLNGFIVSEDGNRILFLGKKRIEDDYTGITTEETCMEMTDDFKIYGGPIWHKGNLKIAHGTVWIAPQSAGVPVYVDVNYASTGFSGVPAILATPWTAIPQTTYVGISNPTSTTCKVYGVRTGGTGGFTVAWLAIGV